MLGKTFTKLGLTALTGLADDELEPLLTGLAAQGDPLDPGRPTLARARPVLVPPGHRQARRLRDDLEEGAQDEAPRGGAVPVVGLERRGGRDRRGRRRPLPRRLRRGARRPGRRRDPLDGPRDARPRGRARGLARREHGGAARLRAGDRADRRPARPGRAARACRDDGANRGPLGRLGGALRAGDRALRDGGCHPSGREGLGEACRDPLAGPRTHRAGAREHGARLRRALAGGARRGPRVARRAARALPVLRRPERPRTATDRDGARDRRGSRRTRDPLGGAEHEGDHPRRARTEARGARTAALCAPDRARQRQALGRPPRVLQPRRHALSGRQVRGGRRRRPRGTRARAARRQPPAGVAVPGPGVPAFRPRRLGRARVDDRRDSRGALVGGTAGVVGSPHLRRHRQRLPGKTGRRRNRHPPLRGDGVVRRPPGARRRSTWAVRTCCSWRETRHGRSRRPSWRSPNARRWASRRSTPSNPSSRRSRPRSNSATSARRRSCWPSSSRCRPGAHPSSCRRSPRASVRDSRLAEATPTKQNDASSERRDCSASWRCSSTSESQQLEHGEWLAAQGRAEEAEPLFAEAREIFERLEAKPWLERVEAVAPLVATP